MPLIKTIRAVVLCVCILVAAYLSMKFGGGLFVFEGRIRNVLEFCLIYVPAFAFPVAVLALWNSRLGAILWILLMAAFFVPQMLIDWPKIHVLPAPGTSFAGFFLVGLLLVATATWDMQLVRKRKLLSALEDEQSSRRVQ